MARVFIYDGRELPDPDSNMSIDDVRQSFAEFFPELSNATHTSKKDGDKTVITFAKRVGTKGAEAPATLLITAVRKGKCECCGDREWLFKNGSASLCGGCLLEKMAMEETMERNNGY